MVMCYLQVRNRFSLLSVLYCPDNLFSIRILLFFFVPSVVEAPRATDPKIGVMVAKSCNCDEVDLIFFLSEAFQSYVD